MYLNINNMVANGKVAILKTASKSPLPFYSSFELITPFKKAASYNLNSWQLRKYHPLAHYLSVPLLRSQARHKAECP